MRREPDTDSVITPEKNSLVSPKSVQFFFSSMFCYTGGAGEGGEWWFFQVQNTAYRTGVRGCGAKEVP